MTHNYDRAIDHIRSIWPEAVNVEDSAEQLVAELKRTKRAFRSLTRDDFLKVLTFPSTDDLCDRCGAKAPLFHDDGDSVCENCITPLPMIEIPHEGNEEESCLLTPKKKRGSHADCDHPATKAARAKCRKERYAALFPEIDYWAFTKKEREFIDALAEDVDPESITLDMIADYMVEEEHGDY